MWETLKEWGAGGFACVAFVVLLGLSYVVDAIRGTRKKGGAK